MTAALWDGLVAAFWLTVVITGMGAACIGFLLAFENTPLVRIPDDYSDDAAAWDRELTGGDQR